MPREQARELWISRKRFREIVAEALDTIPEDLRSCLENVAIVVEDEPDEETLLDVGLDPSDDSLYGLYHGVPLGERGATVPSLPDRIVIYYFPLAEDFTDEYHLRREIRRTVVHEVGHHFGFSDRRMREMGY
jgi:predicted Zn-dependent protease with MMP-like domain